MIQIVDYGMGNLRSVQKAFQKLGFEAGICRDPDQLRTADKLILPGVGAFRDAIHELRELHLDAPVIEHINAGKPFLGICLGLHLLFDMGYEDGEWPGLGVLPGDVVRFQNQPGLKVPHMGWNQLQRREGVAIFEDIPDDAHFYFVHSYFVKPKEDAVVAAKTEHGETFVSAVARDNVYATQFHPEKSQRHGLQLLKNFATL